MWNDTLSSEAMATRFNRLLQEVIGGTLNRNTFQPWEVELLLDIQDCAMRDSAKRQLLKRYQKAVNRELSKGSNDLFPLSEYMLRSRRIPAAKAA